MSTEEEAAERHLISLAIQYQIAGRSAATCGLIPVCGNLLHHAIELILKAILVRDMGLNGVTDLRHKLGTIWREVVARHPELSSPEHDRTIAELDPFERLAAKTVVGPKLGQFARDYPAVELEITTDDGRVDLVSAGYDAGIQFGEYIAQDMVAVRVSPDLRPAVVGAPDYFAAHPRPTSPRDVLHHQCIRFRHRGEGVYKWGSIKAMSHSQSPSTVRCSWMNSTW